MFEANRNTVRHPPSIRAVLTMFKEKVEAAKRLGGVDFDALGTAAAATFGGPTGARVHRP